MELDKRVGEYAAAIVRDVDLLLKDTANLSEEQTRHIGHLKRNADLFLTFYNQHLADFADLTTDLRIYTDIRSPLKNIGGFCGVLLEDYTLATPAERLLLTQIKTAHEIIDTAFVTWVTQYTFPPL